MACFLVVFHWFLGVGVFIWGACRGCSYCCWCGRSRERGVVTLAGWVPAGPIVGLLEERVARSSQVEVAELLWPGSKYGERRLRVVLGQEFLSFDLADRVLCRLGRVDLWYSSPELGYWDVSLSPGRSKRRLSPGELAPGELAAREHGVRARYVGGCRCSECCEAARAYGREYRRRLRVLRESRRVA